VVVLVADLKEPENKDVPVHVAHIRHLIQAGTFNTHSVDFDWDREGIDPIDMNEIWVNGPQREDPAKANHFLPVMARCARKAKNWMIQKTISTRGIVSFRIDDDDNLHYGSQHVLSLMFGEIFTLMRSFRMGEALIVLKSDVLTLPSWLTGRSTAPEPSRLYSTEYSYVVVDTAKKMDATLLVVATNAFRISSGQVCRPSMVAQFFYSAKTFCMTMDLPWAVDAKGRALSKAVSVPQVDTSVDDISESMKKMSTTSNKEDELVKNSTRVIAMSSSASNSPASP